MMDLSGENFAQILLNRLMAWDLLGVDECHEQRVVKKKIQLRMYHKTLVSLTCGADVYHTLRLSCCWFSDLFYLYHIFFF